MNNAINLSISSDDLIDSFAHSGFVGNICTQCKCDDAHHQSWCSVQRVGALVDEMAREIERLKGQLEQWASTHDNTIDELNGERANNAALKARVEEAWASGVCYCGSANLNTKTQPQEG